MSDFSTYVKAITEKHIKRDKEALEAAKKVVDNMDKIIGTQFYRHCFIGVSGHTTYSNALEIVFSESIITTETDIRLKLISEENTHDIMINGYVLKAGPTMPPAMYDAFYNRIVEVIENRMNLSLGELTEGHMGYIV